MSRASANTVLLRAGLLIGCWGLAVSAAAQPTPTQAGRGRPAGDSSAQSEDSYEPSVAPPIPRTVCHGRRIRTIRVLGQGRVAEEDIRATVKLRAGLPCTDGEVTRDLKALWRLGYFDDIVVEADADGREVDLLFRVKERPAIGRIVFEGNDEVDKKTLQEKVTLQEGAVLSVPDVRKHVGKLRDLYAEKGFFLANIDYRLKKLPRNEVEVVFAVTEGDEVTVRLVRFAGNEHLSDTELKQYMQTRETGALSAITSNNTFKREQFDEDINRLQALYYDHGYLTIQVGDPRIELTPDRRHIDITVPVREGPRYRVGRLRILEIDETGEETTPLAGRRRLREQIDLDPGDWFSRSTIAKNLLDITTFYHDHGYAKVDISPQTELEPERKVVHVIVQIKRGPVVHIERINVKGNAKTRDLVIRRELRIVEGELYSRTKIELSKNRVQALGYFESVSVAEEEGSASDGIVLNFEVTERATGTFQIGMGLSSIENFIFNAQIQQQNFLGRGQTVSLQLQMSGIRQIMQLQFMEPYLYETRWMLSLEGFKNLLQFQDFNRDSTGAAVMLGHPIVHDNLQLFVNYRLENVNIRASTSAGFAGTQAWNLTTLANLSNNFREGNLSSIRLMLGWDSRDNRLFPTDGVYTQASVELAHSLIGSKISFLRPQFFLRFYYPVLGGLVFKTNTNFALIGSLSKTGVPISERYFLGGIYTVRGFLFRSLGPRAGLTTNPDPTGFVPAGGLPFGGNIQLYTNVELEFELIRAVGIRGVLFFDAGNTWNIESKLCQVPKANIQHPQAAAAADPCGFHPLALRKSVGFGFRWFSPMGPLRFEWGLPLRPNVAMGEKKMDFQFTIGNPF